MDAYIIDLIIFGILFLFGLMGFISGFTNRILSLTSWAASLAGAYYGGPTLSSYLSSFIESDITAQIASFIGLFLLLLVILTWISKTISQKIKQSKIGILDRNLGLLLGLITGAIFVLFMGLGLDFFLPTHVNNPYFKHSRLFPYVEMGSQKLSEWLPQNLQDVYAAQTHEKTHEKKKWREKMARELGAFESSDIEPTAYEKGDREALGKLLNDFSKL